MIVYEFYFMLCAHSVFFCLQIWSMHINITLLKLACVFRFCFLHLNNECMWISWNFNTSKRKRKRKPFFFPFHSIQFIWRNELCFWFVGYSGQWTPPVLCVHFSPNAFHQRRKKRKKKLYNKPIFHLSLFEIIRWFFALSLFLSDLL